MLTGWGPPISLYLVVVLLSCCTLETSSTSTRSTRSLLTPQHHQPLKGRFLHLTDLHPDPYYTHGALESNSCHSPTFAPSLLRHIDDDEDRSAGYFGLPSSECDSPLSLVNATLNFLSTQFGSSSSSSSSFDYLVWTGDNARHDIDEQRPRSLDEIIQLNRFVANGLRQSLGQGLKVVASVGNNDVWPHNIMFPGPSKITNSLLELWTEHDFVPEQMKHTFARGGYYSVEAIKDELLLISLNTIFFFEKNTAVDGCPALDELVRSRWTNRTEVEEEAVGMDPGSEQLLWLEQQLYLANEKGLQVWLSGHVPPEEGNWYPDCLERYSELVVGYGGNVLGQLFGHMNQDHFSFLTLPHTQSSSTRSSHRSDARFTSASSASSLPSTLYKHFKRVLPSRSSQISRQAWKYTPIHVSPSVIPTYLPSFRIWEYNLQPQHSSSFSSCTYTSRFTSFLSDLLSGRRRSDHEDEDDQRRLELPNPSSPLSSPSRSLLHLTPTLYTQFYIPLESLDLANRLYEELFKNSTDEERARVEEWNERVRKLEPKWQIEYTTLPAREVVERLLGSRGKEEEEEEEVFKKEFMPKEIRVYLEKILKEDGCRRSRRAEEVELERLLDKYDLVPFKVPSKGKNAGLTLDNWMRIGKELVESRNEGRKRHKKKKKKGERGKKGAGRMWERWVERMGVRSGTL